MWLDVETNVYAELSKIKTIKPANYGFNIVKWHSAMETKHVSIKLKFPSAHHKSQYIMDYLGLFLLLMQRVSEQKSISFKTNTFVGILRNGAHCTLAVK
jgi:hypothetical protein